MPIEEQFRRTYVIVMQLMQVQSTKTHIRRRHLVRRLLGRYTLTIQAVMLKRDYSGGKQHRS